MIKRPEAVEFRGKKFTLVGPELKAGDTAPDFECLQGLDLVKLSNTGNKVRIFSVVPSIDTPVCSEQTRKFEHFLASVKDSVSCFTFSLDLPFAQKRFCTVESLPNMQTYSDVHDHSFGQSYGVLIEGLPLPLLSRAVFVVNPSNKITYVEYVASVPEHPKYDLAIAAVKAAGG